MKSNHEVDISTSITTKTNSISAKDVETCLMCVWAFPHSFRGEEKNIHMDRCMEGLGDEDKKLWNKCSGDLKQYIFGFDEHLLGNAVNQSRSSRKKETKRPKSSESRNGASVDNKTSKSKKKIRALVKTKNGLVELPTKKSNKSKEKKLKGEKDKILSYEPSLKKKVKEEEQNRVERKPVKTKILRLPIVTELVFDPSKEFSKGSRRCIKEYIIFLYGIRQ